MTNPTATGGMRTLGDVLDDAGMELHHERRPATANAPLRDEVLDWPVLGPLPEGQCYVVPREAWEHIVLELGGDARLAKSVAVQLLGRIEVASAVRIIDPCSEENVIMVPCLKHPGDEDFGLFDRGDRVAFLDPEEA